ncbi:PepSY domain-containing protein [Corynebacterium sp.]|uniref:PepSY domain-containing protein n=1 Tax=Corynebacterium sp. TaxID=1720 RepID=UPI003736639C
MKKSRILAAAGIATSAALFLSACNDSEDTTTVETTTATDAAEATQEDTAEETTTEETEGDDTVTETTVADDAAGGDDPVFDAIGAVTADYPDGIIISIDREDNTDAYEVDVVQGDEVLELKVEEDGNVVEDDREHDGEDISYAQDTTVSIEDAIQEALEQHQDGFLDEAELDEDNGTLNWDISLDDADRNDLTDVRIAAN